MAGEPLISFDYWKNLQITPQDIEFLHNHLFETETPLTTRGLVAVLIYERNRAERLAIQQRRQAGGRVYTPRESFQAGEGIVFPVFGLGTRKGCQPPCGQQPRPRRV